jgi:transposase
MSDTELLLKSEAPRRLEVFTGAGRRRSWTAEHKAQIVAECDEAGASVSAVARRHGLTPHDGPGSGWGGHRDIGDGASGREGDFMIAVPAGMRVLVATNPIDFRKGADGLAALVRETLGHDPFSGTIFVFRAKRADRIKIVAWDGSGLVLYWKRLEHGAFRWPPITDGVMKLSSAQLAALVDGMDCRVCMRVM